MRELKTIEMHTCGEPARIVIDGMPELRGSTGVLRLSGGSVSFEPRRA